MAVITEIPFTANTITYNGVQFGGYDTVYRSTPPTYELNGQCVYDESRRTVKWVRYILTVHSIFNEDTIAEMNANMVNVRNKLLEAGKTLTIKGIGIGGFGTLSKEDGINVRAVTVNDVDFGPKPLSCNFKDVGGQLAWEVVWQVEFCVSECLRTQRNDLAFAAFNFETSWQNDFEGMTSRTISGHTELAMKRGGTGNKVPQHIADELKEQINFFIPAGYKRTTNIWRENSAKNRLEFVIVDEALRGDVYPDGIIQADGDISISTGNGSPGGGGFASANVTMNMNLRVAPGKPPHLGPVMFLTAAMTKQAKMQSQIGNKGTVLPTSIRMTCGKFDRAREGSYSMSWYLTKSLNEMMKASGIWEPITIPGLSGNTYNSWRTSVNNLWGNRGLVNPGVTGLRSTTQESVVIDLCDNATLANIGAGVVAQNPQTQNAPGFKFQCPKIPKDGGWIHHEVEVRILRKENVTWHRKASLFDEGLKALGLGGLLPFTSTPAEEPDIEHNGIPDTYIGLYFRGLRFIDDPKDVTKRLTMPGITSVAGQPTMLVHNDVTGPKWAFDVFVCPAYFLEGVRVYRVKGHVSEIKPTESLVSLAAPEGEKKDL